MKILFQYSGLKHLPSLLPTSPLKKLNAENCGLESIHESFVRPGINMDLKNNNIKELPRHNMLKFLQSGGDLEYDTGNIKVEGAIGLRFNRLVSRNFVWFW